MDILSYISGDEEVIKLAEMREKDVRDEESRLSGAKEEGKKEGRTEEKFEAARNFLRLGVNTGNVVNL